MSFPWDDSQWCEVGDLLESGPAPGDRILAPDLFWWRLPTLFRYVPENVGTERAYEWVVVHKGEMDAIPRPFLEGVVATMRPVLANEVFVVWSRDQHLPGVERSSPHLLAFVELLARLAPRPTARHPARDDRILGDAPLLRQSAAMTPAEARAAQDDFFRAGGYRYPTARDRAYYGELLYHRDQALARWSGRRVLELCAGMHAGGATGSTTTLVRSDFSSVAMARAAASDRDRTGVDHMVCDAGAVGVAGASCDGVLFIDSIEHVPDAQRVIAEASRVLRPGGELLLTFSNRDSLNQVINRKLGYPEFPTNHQHIREFTLAEVTAMLHATGFEIESTAGIELRPYWGVPGIDGLVRDVIDDDEEVVETLRVLGRRIGAEHAYVGVVRACTRR
jgi:SAM-dependent methyltransferase